MLNKTYKTLIRGLIRYKRRKGNTSILDQQIIEPKTNFHQKEGKTINQEISEDETDSDNETDSKEFNNFSKQHVFIPQKYAKYQTALRKGILDEIQFEVNNPVCYQGKISIIFQKIYKSFEFFS